MMFFAAADFLGRGPRETFMADDLSSLKDDMNAFILGHGLSRFQGYVTEDVHSVLWDPRDNPESWKDFVELAKKAGSEFLSLDEEALQRDELDYLIQRLHFRHISLGTNSPSPASLQALTLMGSITFNGSGRYDYIGQQLIGHGAAVSRTGSGAYSLDQGGFVSLDSPLRAGAKINARFAAEAVIGSSTESTDSTFDLFVAIPAPTGGAVFAGPYNCMSLEFRGGGSSLMGSAQFPMNQSSPGILQSFTMFGHAVAISGLPVSQQVTGATYTMGADGAGTVNAGPDDYTQLLSGSRTLYLSASGNILLGGATVADGHGIMIGVKSLPGAANSSWNGTYWGAGLRVDSSAVSGYSGAVSVRGQ